MTRPAGAPPLLLFDDECGVCRRIASWVRASALASGRATLDVRPIGEDPAALRAIEPTLDIWEAYETIHLVMPDGSLKRGGEAVAEVLRRLPSTRGVARLFALRVLGGRPFQALLDVAYAILADVRPLFGCESCGTPRWVQALRWPFTWWHKPSAPHMSPRSNPKALVAAP